MIKTLESQVGQFLVGCKCPVSRVFVQEQDALGEFPAAIFLQNVLHLHQLRLVILRVDNLALWKIINEEDAVLIPTNRGENFSSGFLNSDFFSDGVSRCAAITRFRPWSPIAPDRKSLRSRRKNSKRFSDDWHR